ncbi:hypothetical protein B0T14DRAFT_606647 [Immersiella caudata]|uniref:Uncharacterized protein n=1 Tax=Immersiella caudata TaxID=314043 RepID=A0AA39WFC1_9PEZI|nr:hypothetical protein B0T14DRAFT_606647 [Immersiella caudata]
MASDLETSHQGLADLITANVKTLLDNLGTKLSDKIDDLDTKVDKTIEQVQRMKIMMEAPATTNWLVLPTQLPASKIWKEDANLISANASAILAVLSVEVFAGDIDGKRSQILHYCGVL